eukprot:29536-Pelagococcus_subviridis.AAC.2
MAWTRHPTYSALWAHSLILHRGRSSPVTDDRGVAFECVFHARRAQPTRETIQGGSHRNPTEIS